MICLDRLTKAAYVFALSLAVFLLLQGTRSQAQFRGTPGNFAIFTFNNLGLPAIVNIPNNGRIIGMPPPPLLLPLNNFYFGLFYSDSTGSPLAMTSSVSVGGSGIGGGAMGVMGFGGQGIGGGFAGAGGGAAGFGGQGFGGGISGVGGFGGQGFGGGISGVGGMGLGGMGGMGGGMGGFAGKGMGGFNGKKAW